MKNKLVVLLSTAMVLLLGVLAISSTAGAGTVFRADLKGENEVPPVADTLATGRAEFEVSADGSMINFKLEVSDIMDFTQSHIHLAPVGVNGPVVVWLAPSKAPATLFRGELEFELEGTITAADLVGPLSGMTLGDLIAEFEAGNAYVNAHTVAHPGGEIRGQIMVK